jgi:hypothetical protein
VDTRYGHKLEKSIICQEGDFILIKPDVLHQPINLSVTEPALAIVARNDPNEQESALGNSCRKKSLSWKVCQSSSLRCKTFPSTESRFLWQSSDCSVK